MHGHGGPGGHGHGGPGFHPGGPGGPGFHPGGPGGPGFHPGGPGGPGFMGGPGGPGFGPPPLPILAPVWDPIAGFFSGATVALAGVGGWMLGRSAAETQATSSTTVVYNYPNPASGTTQSSAGADLEASVTLVALMGPSEPHSSAILFVEEDLIIVCQIGETVQQAIVRGKTSVQSGLPINQTLHISLKGNTKEVQLAVYKAVDNALLALGRVDAPQPQRPGKTHDVSIHLNTLGGGSCGRILTAISYNKPIPRPLFTPPPPAPPAPSAPPLKSTDSASTAADSLGWVSSKQVD